MVLRPKGASRPEVTRGVASGGRGQCDPAPGVPSAGSAAPLDARPAMAPLPLLCLCAFALAAVPGERAAAGWGGVAPEGVSPWGPPDVGAAPLGSPKRGPSPPPGSPKRSPSPQLPQVRPLPTPRGPPSAAPPYPSGSPKCGSPLRVSKRGLPLPGSPSAAPLPGSWERSAGGTRGSLPPLGSPMPVDCRGARTWEASLVTKTEGRVGEASIGAHFEIGVLRQMLRRAPLLRLRRFGGAPRPALGCGRPACPGGHGG